MNQTELIQKAHRIALELGWDAKPAKPNGRMNLLAHTLNAMAIAENIVETYKKFNVFDFSKEELKLILGALFVHDFSKGDKDISEMMAKGKLKELPKRLKGREEVKVALKELGLSEEEIEKAVDLAVQMEYPNPPDLDEFFSSKPVSRKLDRVLKLSDRLAGIESVEEVKKKSISELVKPLEITYHRVSVVRGISTQLLHRATQKVAEKKGFVAILSTPDGTIYLGKNKLKFDKDELVEELLNELKIFIDSFDSDIIGSAAFGRFTNIPIKAPEFVFVSKNAAEGFWKYVESLPAISNPKSRMDRKVMDALSKSKPSLSKEEYEYLFKLYNSMRYLLMMGVHTLKEAKKLNKELYHKITENLKSHGVDVETLVRANPRYNSPFSEIISCVDEFLEKMGWNDRKREEIIEDTAKLFRKATSKAVEEVNVELPDLINPLKPLVNDVAFPSFGEQETQAHDTSYKEYLKGKRKGTPVCPLCGNRASIVGNKPLIGKGTESFSNMLVGGSVIGRENKIRVCELCEFEAKLRSLVMDSKADAYYIVPQCTIAPNLSDYFWSEAKNKLELGGVGEIPSIYDVYGWSRIIVEGKFNEIASKTYSEIFQIVIENACKDKKLKKAVRKALKEYYGSLEEYKKLTGINVKNEKELIKLAFKDEQVLETLGLENLFKTKRFGIALSNNYVVLLLEKLIKDKDNETTLLLLKLFVSLIVSKIFSSSIVISEIPLSVLHVQAPRGAVKLSTKLGLKEFLGPYIKDGWIPFHEVDRLMKKLSALILLERKTQGNPDVYGMTKLSTGEILHRIVQKGSEKSLKEVLKLLNVLENS